MIGGISFSATSITSGLDADKPASPKPGNQYLATDTKILYACYTAGVWSYPRVLKRVMVAGTDVTLVTDTNRYETTKTGTEYYPIHQYTIKTITGFTSGHSYYISVDFAVNMGTGTTTWYIRVNGVTKLSGQYTSTPPWTSISGTINGELKEGDVIDVGMSHTSSVSKIGECRNFTIKCATPTIISEEFEEEVIELA